MASTEEDNILIKVLRQEHGAAQQVQTLIQLTIKSGVYWRSAFIVPIFVTSITCRLVEEWQLLDHVIIDRTIKQWRPRLRSCVCERGGHFEHQL